MAGNALRPEPEMPDVTTGLREALDALNAQWEAQLAQVKDGDKDKLTRPNVVSPCGSVRWRGRLGVGTARVSRSPSQDGTNETLVGDHIAHD